MKKISLIQEGNDVNLRMLTYIPHYHFPILRISFFISQICLNFNKY